MRRESAEIVRCLPAGDARRIDMRCKHVWKRRMQLDNFQIVQGNLSNEPDMSFLLGLDAMREQ